MPCCEVLLLLILYPAAATFRGYFHSVDTLCRSMCVANGPKLGPDPTQEHHLGSVLRKIYENSADLRRLFRESLFVLKELKVKICKHPMNWLC